VGSSKLSFSLNLISTLFALPWNSPEVNQDLIKCAIFFNKRGYPASVVQAGHHPAKQIDGQSALQTPQRENNERISFTLTFHPHNHAVKSIILKKL